MFSPPVTRSAGKFRIGLLGAVAVAVALVTAPTVRAADATPAAGADAAQTQASGDTPPSQAAEHASDAPSQAAEHGSDAPSQAAEHASDAPSQAAEHASDAPIQAAAGTGDTAPGSTNDSATASDAHKAGDQPADDGSPGASGVETGVSLAQEASAGAAAEQHGVGNAKLDVKVDKPGNGPHVSQENRAEGNADATVTAETSTPATSDQSADAAADGSQSEVKNTAVTVRVGSAGDDAPVDQANVAAATASTSVSAPESGDSAVDETAVAAATQDDVSNTSVSIRVFSPGSDGPVSQTNEAVAAAATSGPEGASATATQNGVQNTRVSVRVESPGTSGAVSQQSTASAQAGPAGASAAVGSAVATTKDGLDTDLSIVVDGDRLQQPGATGLQVWVWTWNWDREESDSIGATLDTQPASWNWAWGGANGPAGGLGKVTSRTASTDEQAGGTWTWNWNWTREDAPNWMWQWNWTAALPCGSCVWIWDWTWNWSGQPVQTGSTGSTDETSNTSATPEQSNAVVANAEASVAADVTQTIVQDGGPGEQFVGQLVSVEQVAIARASATQSDVESIATATLVAPQVNRVTSVASVSVGADLAQQAEQLMLMGDDGSAVQWSGQEIDLVQRARADVRSAQRDVSLRTAGAVLADGEASATTVTDVDQRVVQDALVVGGTTDQWAGQLTLVEQSGDAVSVVDQSAVAPPRLVAGTARARSASGALARVDQNVEQRAVRGGGLGSQTAMQIVYVGQEGSTTATTTQQAGSASNTLASSDASATNRALVVQDGVQESIGVSGLDLQDLTQQSIVLQFAVSGSTSAGGIAGSAVVGNCAIVQQGAVQSVVGGPATTTSRDLSAFCSPPSAAPTLFSVSEPAPASSAAAVGLAVTPGGAVETPVGPPEDVDIALFHASSHHRSPAKALRMRATTPRFPTVRSEPGTERPILGSTSTTQISAPRPTQARFDTRPEGHAGDGDAGTEPPLPPAGDPPQWVSALAAAASSGAGPSGIAAILAAFALVPPLLQRAREGSAVRRPIDVLSRVDVPV